MSATDNINIGIGQSRVGFKAVVDIATTSDSPVWHIQLEALRKLSQISNDAPTFELALQRGLEVVAQTLGVEQAVLLLHDSESQSLIPHSSVFGFRSHQSAVLGRIYLNETNPSMALEVFRLGLPRLSNDCPNDPYCNPTRVEEFSVRNQIVVPIKSERRTLGVCMVVNKVKGDFTVSDLELFETLAVPLANLLKNIGLVRRLENQQRRHLAVLDAAVDGFIEVDRDFKITLFNKGAENLTGWATENAVGRTCSEVLMPHSPEGTSLCLNCPLKRAFRTGQSVSNVETLIQTSDGEDNWTACSYNSVTNEHGEVVSGVIAIKDIYRLKALGDELQQQIQQQQSLLGVINAINGLSNIEEIYHRALDEVRKAIHFDVGTIHAIEQDGKVLRLVSQYQVMEGEVADSDGQAAERLGLLDTLKEELDGTDTSQIDEYREFTQTARSRNSESLYHSHRRIGTASTHPSGYKPTSICDALCQNEPYMAVNLPGKAICPVLEDFPELQSHICVPIKTQEHTYGVLHLASYRSYAFWGSDFSLAFNICKQIAVAAERASLFERIDRLARTDALTELYNKSEFWDRIGIELSRAERHNQSLTLMVLDLDRLKWFNDFYGHVYGDMLLSQISLVVRQKSRASDIAFRFGGDELCLLLPATSPEEARVVAERIREAAAEVSVFPNQDVIGAEGLVTMSIGMASYPDDARTGHDLFLCADAAQYRAKNTGKNRVCIYDHAVDFKDLTSRHRNPNDYDRGDARLALPMLNPNDLRLLKNRPAAADLSISSTETEQLTDYLNNATEDTDFEIDPESQYDIEVLPDPTNPHRERDNS